MTKIVPSALIDEIKGKFNGDTFSMWRGIICRKKGTHPRQPRTYSQSRSRQFFSYLSGGYDQLPNDFKVNWSYYASYISSTMTGFNSFLKLNQQLLCAHHASLVRTYNAPQARHTPASVANFSFSYVTGTGGFTSTWSSPLDANYFIQLYFSPMTGYRDTLFPSFTFSQTVASNLGTMSLNGSEYAENTQLRARLRVINTYGEVSAWSETLTAVKA